MDKQDKLVNIEALPAPEIKVSKPKGRPRLTEEQKQLSKYIIAAYSKANAIGAWLAKGNDISESVDKEVQKNKEREAKYKEENAKEYAKENDIITGPVGIGDK